MELVLLCTLLSIFIFCIGSKIQFIEKNQINGFDGEWRFGLDKKIIALFAALLICISTMRYGWIDTYAYKEMYIASRENLHYVNSAPYGVEAGWLYCCYFLNFFSASPKLLLFVSSLIIIAGYVTAIKKYSCDPIFSLVIFYCLLYMDTNNGLRQMVAASMVILAYQLLLERKVSRYILFAAIVLLAMQFHTSAIICLFIPMVVVGKPFNIRIKFAILFGVVFCIMPEVVNEFLGELFSDSKYLNYLDLLGGMTLFRAFITGIFPFVLAVLYLKRCKKNNIMITYEEGILINILFINTLFIMMGVYMQYWNRMGFYTAFAPIVLMPKLAYELFVKKQRQLVKGIAIFCYFVFFAYNIYVNIGYGAINDFYISWN